MRILYSWFNETERKQYTLEDKELLNIQRTRGNICSNVTTDINLSKKQVRKRK